MCQSNDIQKIKTKKQNQYKLLRKKDRKYEGDNIETDTATIKHILYRQFKLHAGQHGGPAVRVAQLLLELRLPQPQPLQLGIAAGNGFLSGGGAAFLDSQQLLFLQQLREKK